MNEHNRKTLEGIVREFATFFESTNKELDMNVQLIPVSPTQTVAFVLIREGEEPDYPTGMQMFRRAVNLVEEVVAEQELLLSTI